MLGGATRQATRRHERAVSKQAAAANQLKPDEADEAEPKPDEAEAKAPRGPALVAREAGARSAGARAPRKAGDSQWLAAKAMASSPNLDEASMSRWA